MSDKHDTDLRQSFRRAGQSVHRFDHPLLSTLPARDSVPDAVALHDRLEPFALMILHLLPPYAIVREVVSTHINAAKTVALWQTLAS